ncbi:PREDICTED: polyadenylate-binding protein RBP47B-like [Brassica oleracea var. oleracea]|uniref:RRM domain-containing protein n=1 Tax=Brassica oleracea var. oleracea TaxID=109376 RepID=A0A0D3BC42_BRAOL|nr:PREDICTED: polyadenylate-binding protein RBP47B-like [Brassica oleracea var. oleracea]
MQTTNGSDSSLATPGGTTPPPPQQWQQQQQQQHWMAAMQYPGAAAMMMMQQQQQMMMYPHQYVPYNYQQHPQFQYASYHQQQEHKTHERGSGDDVKTLWIGDLLHWMDETYLHTCFSHTGEVSSVKVIRNKLTCQSEGYGFVEFLTRAAAEEVLQNFNGSVMPNSEQLFRLNWASFSTGEKRAVENGPELSIFVGDLSPDVTDTLLQELFVERYPSVKSAKVVIDSNTGRSKGYGFVRFGDESERSRALTEMNGAYCSNRQMRVGVATPKRAVANQQQHYSSQAVIVAGGNGANGAMPHGSQSDGESNNSTIFVGGIDPDVTEEDLRQPFTQFGEVVSVKIPVGKGCGFVQLDNRKSADDAIQSLNGTVIGKNTVRLSWGRTPNKQWRGDSGQQWNGGYSQRGQGYNNGGYANNHESNNYPTES